MLDSSQFNAAENMLLGVRMTTASVIRVVVVDDNDLVRSGLSVFFSLEDDLELVGMAENGYKGIELCATLQPDVVLMDVVMPGLSGVEATRVIREEYPNVRVLGFTCHELEGVIDEMIRAGADGCLIKAISMTELSDAIKEVGCLKAEVA